MNGYENLKILKSRYGIVKKYLLLLHRKSFTKLNLTFASSKNLTQSAQRSRVSMIGELRDSVLASTQ